MKLTLTFKAPTTYHEYVLVLSVFGPEPKLILTKNFVMTIEFGWVSRAKKILSKTY